MWCDAPLAASEEEGSGGEAGPSLLGEEAEAKACSPAVGMELGELDCGSTPELAKAELKAGSPAKGVT